MKYNAWLIAYYHCKVSAMSSLEAVEEKLDGLKEFIGLEFKDLKTKQDTTNGRVRGLEIWRGRLVGFSACLTLIILPILFIVIRLKMSN